MHVMKTNINHKVRILIDDMALSIKRKTFEIKMRFFMILS